jgi:GNAT superfamily N-acetyltransferase
MLNIIQVDTNNRAQVDRFIQFHYHLYKDCPQWVPPFISDVKLMLNRKKHPFYEKSDAAFFLAERDGEVVGRVSIADNRPFNEYHQSNKAQFYLFDSIDDQEVFDSLFAAAADWARKRGLTEIIGPKGFASFDGYGVLAEGFEHRQMMNMSPYNYEYYVKLFENGGFEKENEFVSCYLKEDQFQIPEKVAKVAERVLERGAFSVKTFKSKRELIQWANRIGEAYNGTFVNNWEYYPLSKGDMKMLLDNLMVVIDPRLIKLIMKEDKIVGFLIAFPDLSAAMQRHGGRLTPWAIIDIMLEFKRTKWVALNGVGILPEYHGRGGNALLYTEMYKTVHDFGFVHVEQTQMADTAVQVRQDMINLGAKIYKRNRIYRKSI